MTTNDISALFDEINRPVRSAVVFKIYHVSNPDIAYIGYTTSSISRKLTDIKRGIKLHKFEIADYFLNLGLQGIRIQILELKQFQITAEVKERLDYHCRALHANLVK